MALDICANDLRTRRRPLCRTLAPGWCVVVAVAKVMTWQRRLTWRDEQAELMALDQSATFSETGDVNFEKLSAMADLVLSLKTFIDVPYNLTPVDFIQDYLNSRAFALLDDDALTKQSLVCEPMRVGKK